MTKRTDAVTIWPVYIDSSKSRSKGRMVPKGIAVESPTAEEIYEVCRELSYNPTLETSKKFPSLWWEKPGRVIVTKKGKKLQILKEVSKALQRKRSVRKKP